MAGFPNISSFRNAVESSGQIGEIDVLFESESTSNALAGWWQDLFTNKPAFGFSTNLAVTSTAGAAVALNNSIPGALPINGNVSPMNRYLIDAQFKVSGLFWMFYLCDLLLYYPLLNINASPTTLNNSVTLPRYTNGVGVQAIVTTTTALATSNPTLTLNYTDSAGNSGLTSTMVAPNVAQAASTLWLSGAATAGGSPFLAMTSNGQGVKSIQSYTIASGTATGAAAILLVKPLMAFGIPNASPNIAVEKDCILQFPSLPQIYDGACLGLIASASATSSTAVIHARMRYGWL